MGRALAGLAAAALVYSAIAGAAGAKPAGDPETYVHPLKKFTLKWRVCDLSLLAADDVVLSAER